MLTSNQRELTCDNCQRKFIRYKSHSKQRFCCRECADTFLRGANHPKWEGPRIKVCVICSVEYDGRGKYCCSPKCAGVFKGPRQSGKNNPFWRGGRQINSQGYVIILSPKKGRASRYVLEHRMIMERELGRELWQWEIVHHRNGIKHDNRIENLQIVTHSTHSGQIMCPQCSYIIEVH